VSFPLGEDALGLLIYSPDMRMSVQIGATGRPTMGTQDPLAGDAVSRAEAYSTYLAYFGTYELRADAIVHRIETSLFPGWSGQEQVRPFTHDGDGLVLRTPPMPEPDGSTVVNELAWARPAGSSAGGAE
jgi:hypothetical protein